MHKIEGEFEPIRSILPIINNYKEQRDFSGLVLFDNNFTYHPYFNDIVNEIYESKLPVDFSQGLDNLVINEDQVKQLSQLSWGSQSQNGTNYIRFACDNWKQINGLERSLRLCKEHNIKANYFAYFLYNFNDSPKEVFAKILKVYETVMSVGKTVFLFPQEYEPLDSLNRHCHVDKGWTKTQLIGFRKLYTHIHGFLPLTMTGGLFNWIGHNETEFVNLLIKYGTGHGVVKT